MSVFESGAVQPLADRLEALRDRYFVGRAAELEAFRSVLEREATERTVVLFFVHGPGGVGKSVLLRQFARLARAVGARPIALDVRDLEPSPTGFLNGLRAALNIDASESPFEALAHQEQPVLLIDTYELLAPLDTWLRELLLPQLPDRALVVLAGRNPPSSAWRADAAWNELMHVLPLRNLTPSDSRAYLHARGLPDPQHASVLEFTHGHPLALSLLTNLLISTESRTFRPEHAPDTVRALLERFIDRVPSQAHWRALAVCAHARVTTEPLLAAVLDPAEVPHIFSWLRDLPFMEHGPSGLFPHDLAREVLDADLRWRDPVAYDELHHRIRSALKQRWRSNPGLEQQSAFLDFLYLARHRRARAYYDWETFGHMYAEVAAAVDHDEIVSLVRRHEGDDSAHIARYWLERQPTAFVVFRETSQQLAGFAAALVLDQVTAEDLATDPAIAAAWQFVATRAPLRPGERIVHHRFFVGRDAHQDTTIHTMVAVVAYLSWSMTPRLAWSFPAVAEPERWEAMFERMRFPRTPEADFVVGGRRFGVFAHDWRTDPFDTWIDDGTRYGVTGDVASRQMPTAVAPLEVLSRPDFEAAVRSALREYHRPSLAANPLLRSRLAFEHAQGAPNAASLRALIGEAATELRGSRGSRSEKLYRALACTYLESAVTQELAAERLGLPFNTYRYQLAAAIKHLVDTLWQRELHADQA
jgi:AAA ATPase domain